MENVRNPGSHFICKIQRNHIYETRVFGHLPNLFRNFLEYQLQANLSWEATLFAAQWKWPWKAGGLKSEVAFLTNYHKTILSQEPFKTGWTVTEISDLKWWNITLNIRAQPNYKLCFDTKSGLNDSTMCLQNVVLY